MAREIIFILFHKHLSALRIIPLRFMLSSYQDKPTQSKCRHASAVIKIWREREREREVLKMRRLRIFLDEIRLCLFNFGPIL